MPTIRLDDLRIERGVDTAVLSARVNAARLGWRNERLWLRMPGDLAPAHAHGDPFAAGLLHTAMAAGHDLVVDGPVSASLAANLSRMQAYLLDWNWWNPWAVLKPVRLEAASDHAPRDAAPASGLFFSGGVDSMCSLVRAESETGRRADALVFVIGFDVPLHATDRAAFVLSHLAGAARFTGQRLVVLQTNLRQFVDPVLSWDMAHGGGLAAAGHALATHFDQWLISSSDSHYRGDLSGTSTELDRLWSRSGLTFLSVGGQLDRQMKAEILADEPVAHRHLLICWKAPAGQANCGRCGKCVRTMLSFLVIDALDRFETLPHQLPAHLVSAETILAEPYRIVHWEAMIERLSARSEWRPLVERIQGVIERSHRIKRRPRLSDLRSREGRMVAVEWVRRSAQRRLPVAARRRLLPWVRRWRSATP